VTQGYLVKLTLVFGRDDPARVRFAVSPLFETTAALRVALEPRRHRYHLPWLESVRPDLHRLDAWPLQVLSPHTGWHPDFLTPIPAGPGTDISDQLAKVAATPPDQVACEVRRSLTERSGETAPEAAWRLLDDPAATLATLADLLDRCWKLLIAPHWSRLRDLLEADVMYRTQTLGDYGLERMLGDLHERVRWTGSAMIIDWPGQSELHRLDGDGLVLIPTAFNWPSLSPFIDPPARKALAYPARGIAELWQPTRTAHSAALARLLGPTRAALLESLAEPASTSTLARRHSLAPSTVSEHLAALHEARLTSRRRHRHAVIYQQTPLGTQLASAEPAPRQRRTARPPEHPA
jgi:DNA-binding MarR family transcriptional regulator